MQITSIPSKAFNCAKTLLWNCENPGKMLMHTGALAWGLGSAAQIAGIYANDKIKDEKKTFLIAQELGDFGGNVALYYVVTLSFMRFVKRLFDYGRLRFDVVEEKLKQKAIEESTRDETKIRLKAKTTAEEYALDPENPIKKKRAQKAQKSLESFERLRSLGPDAVLKKKLKTYFRDGRTMAEVLKTKTDKETQLYFMSRQKGAGILAAIFASVISSNILTPYLRNYLASRRQEITHTNHYVPMYYCPKEASRPSTVQNPVFKDFIM